LKHWIITHSHAVMRQSGSIKAWDHLWIMLSNWVERERKKEKEVCQMSNPIGFTFGSKYVQKVRNQSQILVHHASRVSSPFTHSGGYKANTLIPVEYDVVSIEGHRVKRQRVHTVMPASWSKRVQLLRSSKESLGFFRGVPTFMRLIYVRIYDMGNGWLELDASPRETQSSNLVWNSKGI
jgi:hypothetical protein